MAGAKKGYSDVFYRAFFWVAESNLAGFQGKIWQLINS